MALVAGVDSSTQSCTVSLLDADTGTVVAEGRARHRRAVPPVSEQDPADWWSAFCAALAEAGAVAGVVLTDVAAISVAGQCHGLVALDTDDEVLRPAKLWNDTTSAPQAKWLTECLGVAEWTRLTGSAPTAAFTISKVAWLAEHEAAIFARLRHILLPHDWLTWRLTGEMITDRSEASGTGYFDGVRNQWCPGLLEMIDDRVEWPAMLPRVCGPTELAGVVSQAAAEQTGLRAGIPVGPGAGDQHAAALALDVQVHDLLISLGTSGVALTRSDVPVADTSGLVNGVCDARGRFLPLVCTLNGTQVTDAFAGLLGVDLAEFASLALAEPAHQPDRPVLAAFLGGERSPNLPDARGLLGGLALGTSRGQIARAAFEGVLLGLLAGADALTRAGLEVSGRLLVTGGGSRSRAYLQLLADLAEREVTVLDLPDATVRGAAVQAAAVLSGRSLADVLAQWQPLSNRKIEPRPGACAAAVRSRYVELSTWPGHHRPWKEKA